MHPFQRTVLTLRNASLLLALVLLVPSRPAAAAPEKNSPAARAFAQGMRHYKKSNYEKAIEAFNESYKLHPHFLTQCNIARCHERLSDMTRAAIHYERCLKEGGGDSGKAQEIREALKNVMTFVAKITVRSPGTAPAEVFIDGVPAGKTPLESLVNPGPHEIEVRRPGERPQRTTVQLDIGEERSIVLHTAAETAASGSQDTPVAPTPRPRKSGLSPLWFWSAVGLTAALGITTIVLGSMTLRSNTDYEDDPTQARYDRVIDLRLATNVCVGLTAAAAAGTTFLFFYTDFGTETRERSGHGRAFVVGIQGRF